MSKYECDKIEKEIEQLKSEIWDGPAGHRVLVEKLSRELIEVEVAQRHFEEKAQKLRAQIAHHEGAQAVKTGQIESLCRSFYEASRKP